MTFTRRQLGILQSARQFGTIGISELAAELAVSQETVRRDVRLLVDRGDLIKLHGAVRHPEAGREAPFERRMRENVEAKRLIACHAARAIEDGDSMMIDTGTTTSIFARELLGKRGLTIVTNSSDVARTLATVNGNKVYMAGGELHGDNGAAFGSSVCDFISGFNVRHAVISIAAISARSGLMDYELDEAEVARIVLQRGERKMVLADSTKFARTALVRVAGIDEVDVIVTESPPPHELGQAIASAGASIEIASASTGVGSGVERRRKGSPT